MTLKEQGTSFGRAAKDYQKYRRSYDSRLYRLIFSKLHKLKSSAEISILDIGCGTGKSTEPIFASAGKHKISVVGIDPDKEMLKQARLSAKKKRLHIRYVQGHAESLPFNTGSFDIVITGAAFHWFANKRAIAQIRKVLKEGGLFCVFWAQYVKSEEPTIGQSLYVKYKWRGIPQKFRGVSFVREVLSSSGFKNVKTKIIPFTEHKTIKDTIGLIATNSSYIMMPSVDKRYFLNEMKKDYEAAWGKGKLVTEKYELRVCYGFK